MVPIRFYKTTSGCEPFFEWLEKLKDKSTQRRILQRLERIEEGNWGDCKSLGDGIIELRMFFGPGYRVYLALVKGEWVLLLGGGDKSTQTKDIAKAKNYWQDYQERNP